jgi:Methyltransferase domain
MSLDERAIRALAAEATNRLALWNAFARGAGILRMLEIGVSRGRFASAMLEAAPALQTYYMIDPWRHLDDWNKPANRPDDVFERCFQQTLAATEFAAAKRVILRGKTTEVIDRIADGSLDFAYIDGDHTLRGITIDLLLAYPKVRSGGWIGGDDFTRTIWDHESRFEPTLVFPYAVYFAEAVGARIYSLPHKQFLMEKTADTGFAFVDVASYGDITLQAQFEPGTVLKIKLTEAAPRVAKILRALRNRTGLTSGRKI